MNNFITLTNKWPDGDIATYIMDKDARCFAMVKQYSGHYNYNMIQELCVKEEFRGQGYATRLLNYIDQHFTARNHTCVKVESNAPDWLVKCYNKRNYIIWE